MEREEILTIYNDGDEAVINLIGQQTVRIAELEEIVKSLEERLNKNSRNSSKPPSTDAYAPKKPKPKKCEQSEHFRYIKLYLIYYKKNISLINIKVIIIFTK
jgi:hypothetical protein